MKRRSCGLRRAVWMMALALAPAPELPARPVAVIVGIPDFLQDINTAPVRFASHDADLFQQKIAASFLVFPAGAGKGMFTTKSALNQAMLQERRGDTVFLFFSTRGIARPGAQDGYIGASDLVAQKKESTAVKISELVELIKQSDADQVIIFADLCREPAQPAFDNRINILVSQIAQKVSKPVAGILATGPRQFSKEDANLAEAGEKGFGVFGYYLVDAGAKSGTTVLKQLFGSLVAEMPNTWQRSQRPQQFGSAMAAMATLWRMAALGPPWKRLKPDARRLVLSASLDPFLLEDEQDAANQAAEIDKQLADPASIRDFAAFTDSMRKLEPQLDPQAAEQLRARAAGALGDEGQVCVARYGTQDFLPDDPLRVKPAEFARCAEALAAAETLAPHSGAAPPGAGQTDGWDRFRKMLHVRELYCRAQSGAAGSLNLLLDAAADPTYDLAEVQDALGISVMQTSQPDRYPRAKAFFERAKAISPEWLYPRHNLALLYAEQGDMRSAEREYREALLLPHPQPYVYYNYGLTLERLNRPADAAREFRQALTAYDDAIAELESRAREWAKDYPRDADLALRRAQVFRSGKAEVYNVLGSVLEGKHNRRAAVAMYETAAVLDPGLCPPLYNLARMESQQPLTSDALGRLAERLRASLERCPDFTPSLLLEGKLDLWRSRFADAVTAFQRVASQAPSNTAALLGLASAENGRGNRGAAAYWLEQAVSVLDRNPGIRPGSLAKIENAPADLSLYRPLVERYRNSGFVTACRAASYLAIAASKTTEDRRAAESMVKLCNGTR